MNAAPPPSGVATAAKPAPALQLQPEPATTFAGWPRSAQVALAVLLALAAALLGWQGYTMQSWGSRPTDLDTTSNLLLRIDLNRADRAQLLQLPGMGESLVRRILAYRVEHHGFRDVEELRNVSGIGPAVLERLRPFVYVEGVEDDEDEPPPAPSYPPTSTVPARKTPPVGVDKKTTTKKTDGLKERINVNQATAAQLQQLPGVGPKLSERIIDARTKKPFQSVDDLRNVPGIGAKTLENLRPYVTVDPSAKGETNP